MGLWWGGVTEGSLASCDTNWVCIDNQTGARLGQVLSGEKARSHLALHLTSLPGWHGASMIKLKVIPFPRAFSSMASETMTLKGKKQRPCPTFPRLGEKPLARG